MFVKHRFYSDEQDDFKCICDFIIANNTFISNYTSWSFQRFVDWRYGLYEHRTKNEGFWDKNLILFFDALDKIVGLTICENGDENLVIITSAKHRMLYPTILKITHEVWPEKMSQMQTEISILQEIERSSLEASGFIRTDTFYKQCFDLLGNLPIRQPILDGYHIVDMETSSQYEAQAHLRASAFNGQDALTEEQLHKRLATAYYSHKSPTYHAGTDLCMMNSEGIAVAGCEPLLNPWCGEAEIERVCTLKAYRKMGHAKQLIIEALYRLKAMGLEKAYITGYSQEAISLYKQLGASEAIEMYTYEKRNDN